MFNRVIAAVLLAALTTSTAFAGDLDWSGVYRIEGNMFENTLGTGGKRKEYGVHHLILRPRIVGADGLYINSQLNIFNSKSNTWGDQLGAVYGNGLNDSPSTSTTSNSGNSNTLSERQEPEQLRISQFYLTMVQEFGSLIVGRAPIQFGLGMTHSAGRGMFDHYMDTRDMVGYKMVMGNFYLLPMLAKVDEGGIGGYDDVNDMFIQLQYENGETDTEMGVMYWTRKAGFGANDSEPNTGNGPYCTDAGGCARSSDYDYELYNFYFAKKTDNYSFGIEVANQSGDAGIVDSVGNGVQLSGMGIALDFGYHPKEKRWGTGIKAGFATGDDKTTTDEYEGFVFDRNYDVAMILFNHAVGQLNVLHTEVNGTTSGATGSPLQDPDVESVSNVTYLAPYFNYKYSDRWTINGVFATGQVDQTKLANGSDTDKDLGYELDVSLSFTPNERVTWQNTFGWFMPGKAFEGSDAQDFSTGSVYGFMSRAAISF
jgi:hypothetical protein